MRTRLLGLLAVLGIAAFLFGVPAALIAMFGSPLPSAWPTMGQVSAALTHLEDGTFLLVALRVVVWLAWGYFAIMLLWEIAAQLRGLRAPHLPGTGKQRLAAGLVSTAGLLFASAPLATAAPTVPHAVTVSWSGPQAPAGPSTSAEVDRDRDRDRPDYVVEQGDTLWDIADRKLGEGEKYPKLYRASRDTVQPDGQQLTDPDHIEPGWRITVPGKTGAAPQTNGRPDPTRDGARQAQTGSAGQDGQERQGLAQQGQQQDDDRRQARREQRPPTVATAPTPTPRSEPSPAATPAPTPAAAAVAPDPIAAPEAVEEDQVAPLRTMAGVGALLAAGFTTWVAGRRLLQRRRRRPGEALPMPDPAAAVVEQDLAMVADAFSVELVDRALRTLALGCQREHRPLPQLRAARLTHDTLDLYLGEPAQLPEPWTGTVDAAVWTLSAQSAGLLDPAAVQDVAAPYPSLVTVGQDAEGGHVLLDLEHVAALGILGSEPECLEVLTGLAVELATSRWADDVQVTVVGALPELEDCFQTGRVRYLPTPALLLTELAARVRADGQAMNTAGIDLATARPAGALTGLWTPEIVLVTQPLTDDQRAELAAALQTHPRAAVAAVTATDALSPWAINLTATPVTLEPLDLALTPQRVDPATYQGLIAVAATANDDPAPTPQEATTAPEVPLEDLPAGEDCSPEPAPAQPIAAPADTGAEPSPVQPPTGPPVVVDLRTAPTDAQAVAAQAVDDEPATPLIRVLGPVDVVGATGPLESTKRGVCTELAAFIALTPQPTPAQVDQSVWPPHPDRPDRTPEAIAKGRRESISKLRRWLGANPDGEMWLPTSDGHYGFLPGVTTDWHLFQAHLAGNLRHAPDQQLEAALELVRGQPFTVSSTKRSRRYCWAEALQQQMITAIADVAYELAQRYLSMRRWRDAARVSAAGLAIDPVCQPLWRARLKAAHCAGAADEADRIINRIRADAAVYDDGDLDEDTAELIDSIRVTRVS